MHEVRYGLIGVGMMGVEHLRNLRVLDGARVTAIADPHQPSREVARLHAPDAGWQEFEDHRELLASAACDAVVVSTPNHTHLDVMLDVLATDHHVMVEKPLCTTVEDCRRVLDAAKGHRGVVWVGLEYRYMPPIARLIEEVHAGAAGRVRMVAIREHRFPFLAKVGDWNRFNRNTGGTLVEKCCHFFDLMHHIVGSEPVRVLGSGAQDVNHLDERYDGETPDIIDNAYVIVEFADGARAVLDLCMFAEASEHQEELAVVGDDGKAEAFLPSCELRVGRRSMGRPGIRSEVVHDERIRYEGFHHGSSYLEHLDFLAAVRSGVAPKVALEDGLRSVAMGVAAQEAIASATSIDVAR